MTGSGAGAIHSSSDGEGDSGRGFGLISVVVCTRNRSRLLARCLEGLERCVGIADAEVMVVDNGSTDDTAAVCDRWSSRLPLRYVVETRVGLSNARNRAFEEARGDVVAFLDDDVVVAPGWLVAMAGAFERWPDAGGVGGRVELSWPAGRPTWLPESREVWFARLDLGTEARPMSAGECPVGANMAVRRSVAADVGGFDPELGYSGTKLLGNEEVDFFARLRRQGLVIAYEPAASVTHVVEGARVSPWYLLRRVYSQGRSDVRMEAPVGSPRDARSAGRDALGRATVRGWRGDLGRLRADGSWQANLVDVLTGRAKQLGRAREWAAVSRDATARSA